MQLRILQYTFRHLFRHLIICHRTKIFDQAIKSIRWMPWHGKAMKDVVSCDKPRAGANNLKPGDFRMGQPVPGNAGTLPAE